MTCWAVPSSSSYIATSAAYPIRYPMPSFTVVTAFTFRPQSIYVTGHYLQRGATVKGRLLRILHHKVLNDEPEISGRLNQIEQGIGEVLYRTGTLSKGSRDYPHASRQRI